MRTILLVEDDNAVRALVLEILEALGYAVLTASTPSEAIAAAGETDRLDVLLTDLALPEMSGADLAATLVETRPGLRVVFTSGRPSDERLRAGLPSTQVAFIEKPYLPDELARVLEEVLSRPDRESGPRRRSGGRPASTCTGKAP